MRGATVLLAAGAAADYTFVQDLNAAGTLKLSWNYDDTAKTVDLKATATVPSGTMGGYLAIGFSPDGLMHNGDYIIGFGHCVIAATNNATKGDPPAAGGLALTGDMSFYTEGNTWTLTATRPFAGGNPIAGAVQKVLYAAGSQAVTPWHTPSMNCSDVALSAANHHDLGGAGFVGSANVSFASGPAPTPAPPPLPRTPAPAPPTPPAPVPPPSPAAPRYHCLSASKQCVVQSTGHSTVEACLSACGSSLAPRYHCDASSQRCLVEKEGHSTPEQCLAACGAAPPPAPPAPTPAPAPAPTPPTPPTPPAPPAADKYVCTVCQHVYDAKADGGGAAFADLPDTWVCPVCGAPKSAYTKSVARDGRVRWSH